MRRQHENERRKDDAENAESSHRNEILVSIILTESTSSLLSLDVPNLEDCAQVEQSACIIKPVSTNTLLMKQSPSVFSYIFGFGSHKAKENEEITTEPAFFSDHFNAESASTLDLRDEIDELEDVEWVPTDNTFLSDDEIVEPMLRNLNSARVYMKPLVNVKTTLHEDNIAIEDNEIIVNLIDEDNSSISSELICRICHGGESMGDLLKPCRCRGTIALVHIECLEHWLRESANSYCELCKHHFRIVRQPRYGLLWSICVYLTTPGEIFRDVIIDLLAFIFYTPAAIATTYMLMVICENMARAHLNRTRTFSAHLVAFCAIFGMAAIDFTYSSWLILTFQKHAISWRSWYRNNSYLKLLLPDYKKKAYSKKSRHQLKIQKCKRDIIDDPNISGGLSSD